jgi:protein TonB
MDPKVVKGIGGGCDEEALRVVETIQFTPGRQRGEAENVKFSLPVRFQLSSAP